MKHRVVMGAIAAITVLAVVMAVKSPQQTDAQSVFVASANNSFTGTMAAGSDVVGLTTEGRGGAAVVLTGTWVGTVSPQVSIDGGTTYVATQFYNILNRAVVDSATANGSFVILGVGGTSHVRVIMSPFTSGTATAVVRSTAGEFRLPAIRDPNVIKSFNNGASTAAVAIWTPASGKKVRIISAVIDVVTDTTVTLEQGAAATVLATLRGTGEHMINFGPSGFLTDTADATIAIKGAAASQIVGGIWGREE